MPGPTRESPNPARPPSVVGRIGVLLLALAGVGACGPPADEQVTTYNAGDLPDVLTNTTTTTPPTTTTLPPPSTAPPLDGEMPSTTTTVPPLETSPVEVFYTLGFSDDLQRTTLNLPSPVSLARLTSVLELPPAELSDFNLRSSVRPDLVVEPILLDRGTATVDLSQTVLDRMTSSQERRAIAQIVLTLTSFVTPGEGAIGQVRFTVDGEPIPVFLPTVGGDSEPGEPVAYADFGVLVAPVVPTTTTTTTTTTTSTTTTTTVPSTTAPANSDP